MFGWPGDAWKIIVSFRLESVSRSASAGLAQNGASAVSSSMT